MKRKEIAFVIDKTGEITATVKGMKGRGCKAVSEQLQDLGTFVSEAPTSEYYEHEQSVGIDISTNGRR